MTKRDDRETRAWDSFKRSIDQSKLKVLRIENLYSGEGMPDVIGINRKGTVFWIENKALEEWPARASTMPLKNSFEAGQLGFGRAWRFWNGISFVLLRVGKDQYMLLDPNQPLDSMTGKELIESAYQLGKKEIIAYLEEL
jgi:DNA-binding XRE family transcriptional regulator